VAELGNLTAGILLSPRRMSTVKIRARSLFRTPVSRIGPEGAGSGAGNDHWKRRASPHKAAKTLGRGRFSSALHSPDHPFTACTQAPGISHLPEGGSWCKVREYSLRRVELRSIQEAGLKLTKTAAEVCPLCEGTGWKTLSASPSAPKDKDKDKDRRVTRCDCQLRARGQSLLVAANIPRRYEHCELASYTADFPGAHPSLAFAHLSASKFVQEYDPRDGTGLLIIGKIGTGKTHLAVGIIKELILTKGISCLFSDYRELLKEIQNSYNATVQTTELDVLRPVFETDVLVLDELGAVKPTEWVWDTVSLILNTRYNDNRTTIITTNFEDQPAAGATSSVSPARAATRAETLGDRIGERMRSRLHEMCRVITLDGADFRQTFRSASFR
jgi:DNA replication protein DnaC